MVTLYHCVSARRSDSVAAGRSYLSYQLKMLPFPPRALAREFLQETRWARCRCYRWRHPTIESAAMRQYLAAIQAPGVLDHLRRTPFGSYPNWLHE